MFAAGIKFIKGLEIERLTCYNFVVIMIKYYHLIKLACNITLERKPLQSRGTVINMSKLKAILGISAIAGAIGALFAYKKKKEMEEYDYEEEFDECFCDDCCYPDEESAEKAINESAENSAESDEAENLSEEAPEEIAESAAPEAEADQAEE